MKKSEKTALGECFPRAFVILFYIFIVLDSACVTGSQGLLVYEACRMRDAGYSMEELLAAFTPL